MRPAHGGDLIRRDAAAGTVEAHHPVGIDQQQPRDQVDVVAPGDLAVVEQRVEGHRVGDFFQVLFDGCHGILDEDVEKHDVVLGQDDAGPADLARQLLAGWTPGCRQLEQHQLTFEVGQPNLFTGEEVRLSDFEGQLVLLKLATTWCPTCQQLSGEIRRASVVLAEHNVVFLDVFVQDSVATVEEYLEKIAYPMTFHALLDDGQVARSYNIYLIPRLLLVDADRVVRFDSAGRSVSADEIAAMGRAHRPPLAARGS